jgi:S-formylglutathione hydrolase FrmB
VNWVDHLSLLSGPVPLLLAVGAFATLGASALPRGRREVVQLVGLAAGSLVLVVLLANLIDLEQRVRSSFPHSFFVWMALPVFAMGVAVARWTSVAWSRRVASLASVVLLVAFGADRIDQHYSYLPTVGDVLGAPVEDQVVMHGPRAPLLAERPYSASTPGSGIAGAGRTGHGEVVAIDIPGTVSGFHARQALVWLPPAWFVAGHATLPAVIVLGGVPGNPGDMIRGGRAVHAADAYADRHGGMAPILVFPDDNGSFLNDTECVDGPQGRVETYLMNDVRSFVEAQFGASNQGARWGIVGFSEGGTCAITLALRHPKEFAGFVDLAGELAPSMASGPSERQLTTARLYGGNAAEWWRHDPRTLLQSGKDRGLLALFATGVNDHRRSAIADVLAAATRQAGLDTRVAHLDAGHDFEMVRLALEALLPPLADRLGAPSASGPPV